MKTPKKSISIRLRTYSKSTTKKNVEQRQVEFEIRNFTPKPIRISVKDQQANILTLKSNQFEKQRVVSRQDASILNAWLTTLKNRTFQVMDYLLYINDLDSKILNQMKNDKNDSKYLPDFKNVKINKPLIEHYLYNKWFSVQSFYQKYNSYIKMYDEFDQASIDEIFNNDSDFDFEESAKPLCIIEAIDFYQFENLVNNGKRLKPYLVRYVEFKKRKDISISEINKNMMDDLVNWLINIATKSNSKNNKKYESDHYSPETVKYVLTQTKILIKNLINEGYQLDNNLLNYNLTFGGDRKQIKYNIDNTVNNWVLTPNQFKAIESAINDNKLSLELRNTAKLYTLAVLLGGLRISEIEEITKDSFIQLNGNYTLFLDTKKNKRILDNPINEFVEGLLKSINFSTKDLLKEIGSRDIYNQNLKKLIKVLDIDKELALVRPAAKDEKRKAKKTLISKEITSHSARYTAISVLYSKGYKIHEIQTMTKQSERMVKSYIKLILNEKKEMMDNLNKD
jgi:integrase